MATRGVYGPLSAEFPTTNAPALTKVNGRPALAFDASTDESAWWTDVAPQGLTGTMTAIAHCIMASATSGTLIFQVALEAVTPGDAVDLDAGDSFDTVNTASAVTVPGTAGYEFTVSVTLTNADSIAAGDYFRLKINRDTDDTATGDAYLMALEFRDAA